MSMGGGSGGTMRFKFNHASNFFSDKQFFFIFSRKTEIYHSPQVGSKSYAVCCITGCDTHNKNIL